MTPAPSKLQIVREAHGSGAPDWIVALAQACDARSQNKVARDTGVSASAISQVLSGTYKARTSNIEDIVRTQLMMETVTCPRLGVIELKRCRHWRERTRVFRAANHIDVQMFRACTRCPRNAEKEASDA